MCKDTVEDKICGERIGLFIFNSSLAPRGGGQEVERRQKVVYKIASGTKSQNWLKCKKNYSTGLYSTPWSCMATYCHPLVPLRPQTAHTHTACQKTYHSNLADLTVMYSCTAVALYSW